MCNNGIAIALNEVTGGHMISLFLYTVLSRFGDDALCRVAETISATESRGGR